MELSRENHSSANGAITDGQPTRLSLRMTAAPSPTSQQSEEADIYS